MASSLSGFVLDPAKCSQLSMKEKRDLVHQIAQQSNSKDASEILSSFTRRELLEIICAEMGKERKYTGFTKFQMIEHLMKLVSLKSNGSNTDIPIAPTISPGNPKPGAKRQRNEDNPVPKVCGNVACKATLSQEDTFCRRCSCCICRNYDDNKDPSLWLTCGSEPPDEVNSCGISCHLKCALSHARSGIAKSAGRKLDGGLYCVSCGKVNGLMGLWRKQVLVAKEARRVDELCLRISLAEKILKGTERFKDLQKTVKAASKLLKDEIGPVELAGTRMVRGLVNRLSCGAEVQKLCSSALESFDSTFSGPPQADTVEKEPPTCRIHFEELSSTSVVIVLEYEESLFRNFLGCRLWHREYAAKDYSETPTFIVLRPEKRFKITGLLPLTEYFCKVLIFSNSSVLGVWEAKWATLVSPKFTSFKSLAENRPNHIHCHMESSNSSEIKFAPKQLYSPAQNNICPISFFPTTPNKPNEEKHEIPGFGCRRRTQETEYDFSVRAVKWLEQRGDIDADFRVKFLTWFSLKATKQERKVVSVFVDTLIDDPESLAGQLIHSFTDEICSYRDRVSRHGENFR
ncbi:VIN3-like protein 2 [Punica granatum]|uniref:Uncharacterized protein n=2 Tax=Punica granatum TaxID=22663 RepID=A0A218W5F0_PUNGR|nr:VIN3-like protein 2 [Punica granatum]OWM67708.1 hypothetical protein CDL15_Pgr019209 [Punica granatum]PKI73512.1 hypothetical protein CRG98_006093 [Punica granatum]